MILFNIYAPSLVQQDSVTIDSIDTTVHTYEANQELSRFTPEATYKAWFRILGSLGNVNKIRSPEQHNRIMKTLFDIWKMLCRVCSFFEYLSHVEIVFFRYMCVQKNLNWVIPTLKVHHY